MWSRVKEYLEKLKALAAEYAIWAERELKGKSGAEKRAAVVRKVSSLIPAPWYLAPIKDWLIGRAVDFAVERLNWGSGWNFADTQDVATAVSSVLESSTRSAAAPQAYRATDNVDARLNELYEQYGILKEEPISESPPAPLAVPIAEVVSAPVKVDIGWDDSIRFVLKWEGSANFTIVNGKPVLKPGAAADMGGLTNMGITASTLAAAKKQGLVGHSDITRLTLDEAKKIYRANFWDKWSWGALSWPVCLCCLDITVNHGPAGMARIVQRACNALGKTLDVDGKYGPRTKAALTDLAVAKPVLLAERICYYRKDYYERIIAAKPSQAVFQKGWYNRLRDLAAATGVKSPV